MIRHGSVTAVMATWRWCLLLCAASACGYRAPNDGRRVIVSEASITFVDQQHSASVPLAELQRIVVRTNDRGPWGDDMFWVFSTPTATLEVPSGIAGEKDLWPFFKRLPGFDERKVVEASGSTSNAEFVCWTKAKQAQ